MWQGYPCVDPAAEPRSSPVISFCFENVFLPSYTQRHLDMTSEILSIMHVVDYCKENEAGNVYDVVHAYQRWIAKRFQCFNNALQINQVSVTSAESFQGWSADPFILIPRMESRKPVENQISTLSFEAAMRC